MAWHHFACPDCPWHTTQPSALAATTLWSEHYATAHTRPTEQEQDR